jgi:hypothetical protein
VVGIPPREAEISNSFLAALRSNLCQEGTTFGVAVGLTVGCGELRGNGVEPIFEIGPWVPEENVASV